MNADSKTDSALFAAFCAAVLITCLFVVATAFAGEAPDAVPREIVKVEDLNVSSPAGVAVLYKRIHSAAQRVCQVGQDHDLDFSRRAKICADEAESRAVSDVNILALSAYYQMKTGRQAATLTASLAK
jgi:UrcA family protein